MMGASRFLANRSKGKFAGGFAKIARTSTSQYFLLFGRKKKICCGRFLSAKLDISFEVCQNGVQKPGVAGVLLPAGLKPQIPFYGTETSWRCDRTLSLHWVEPVRHHSGAL